MKNLLRNFIVLIFGMLLMQIANAQVGKSPLDDVLDAIKNNRIQEIRRYLDNFVPITINNSQSNYSHNQAQLVLSDFFNKNPAKEFMIMNTGASTNTTKFAIADFNTPNGRYNIYILMRQKDNSYVVKEIRLNKE